MLPLIFARNNHRELIEFVRCTFNHHAASLTRGLAPTGARTPRRGFRATPIIDRPKSAAHELFTAAPFARPCRSQVRNQISGTSQANVTDDHDNRSQATSFNSSPASPN